MGESTVDPPRSEDKMGSVGEPTLEVSVSFGRFENDSLSWDRWSSFSQNKYLEEVEKCATPGSVAMKKAYFEAHYKKIAAKKAALMDQQADMEYDKANPHTPNGSIESEVYTPNDQCFTEELLDNTLNEKAEPEIYKSNEQCFTEEIMHEMLNGNAKSETFVYNDRYLTEENNKKMIDGVLESEVHQSNGQCFVKELKKKISSIGVKNSTSVTTSATDSESSSVEKGSELGSGPDTSCSTKPAEDIFVKETTPSIPIEDHKEAPRELMKKISSNGVKNSTSVISSATDSEGSSVEKGSELGSGPDTPCSTKPAEDIFVKETTPSMPIKDHKEAPRELMKKISSIIVKNSTGVISSATDSEGSSVEKRRELYSGPDTLCSVKPSEDIFLKETTPSMSIEDHTEAPRELVEEKMQAPKIMKEIMRKDLSTKPKKTTKVIKERIIARVPKNTAPPLAKTPQIAATPRVSKPSLTPNTPSFARSALSSTKKGTNPSQTKSGNFSTGEKRRVVSSSLHMSYSSDPRKLDLTTPATARKSMIMEKMGDKDIVKRAFRTFQNSVNQLKPSTEEIPSLPNQIQRKATELKVSSSTAPQKDERSYKAGAANGRIATSVSSSTSLRSNVTTDTRKKLVKNFDEKSSTKEADKTRSQSKVKDQKEAEMKKIRQSLNFKATPLPNFYKVQQISKTVLNKVQGDRGNDTVH